MCRFKTSQLFTLKKAAAFDTRLIFEMKSASITKNKPNQKTYCPLCVVLTTLKALKHAEQQTEEGLTDTQKERGQIFTLG